MIIPTEPIGSIPRPLKLLSAITRYGSSHQSLEPLYIEAVRDTIEQFEATGSPIVTDGEQRKYQNSRLTVSMGCRISHQMGSNCQLQHPALTTSPTTTLSNQ
jgi:hypothetical protein